MRCNWLALFHGSNARLKHPLHFRYRRSAWWVVGECDATIEAHGAVNACEQIVMRGSIHIRAKLDAALCLPSRDRVRVPSLASDTACRWTDPRCPLHLLSLALLLLVLDVNQLYEPRCRRMEPDARKPSIGSMWNEKRRYERRRRRILPEEEEEEPGNAAQRWWRS